MTAKVAKIIEIVVSPDGTTRVETKGFTGSDCREASKFIEQAMGRPSHEQLTGEFYHRQCEQQNLREGA